MPLTDLSLMGHSASRFVAVWLAIFSAGCATIGLDKPVHQDERLKSFRVEVPQKGDAFIDIEQVGTDVVMEVRKRCRVEERHSVRRTTTRERVNQKPAVDWVYGLAGGASLGAGAGIITDAQLNVAPNDDASQSYNPFGPTYATLIGAGLAAAGVGMLVVPIADAARSSGAEEKVEVLEIDGNVIESGKPCSKNAVAHKSVTGRLMIPIRNKYTNVEEPKNVDLGSTNEDGQLEIDLTEAAGEADPSAAASEMRLFIDQVEVGKVDLTPLFQKWESAEWDGLNRDSCSNPSLSTDCDRVAAFVQRFPRGKHNAVGTALVRDAEAKIQALRDEEAWAASENVGCNEAPKLDSNSAVRSACDRVRRYVRDFPKGAHKVEATKLVAAADKRDQEISDMAAKAEQDAQAKATKAAMAAEAREREAERRRCRGQCKLGCSTTRKFDLCFQGCVESQCD